jgi:lipopolysaccharide/colanic/teichoic acid biosynthesis glycosyltransferase
MAGATNSGRVVKRTLDVMAAGILLVLSAPLLVVLALSILITDPGPVIFQQTRIGFRNRRFSIYKLRTMFTDADARLAQHFETSPDDRREWLTYRRLSRDPRVIPWMGAFLRRSSLDEVPQLWNVIRGDMSLVGPRPLEPEVVEHLGAAALEDRAAVRPGLTGLWQVSGRSDLDLRAMISLDDEYVREWSIASDLAILARTPRAVLSRRGAF